MSATSACSPTAGEPGSGGQRSAIARTLAIPCSAWSSARAARIPAEGSTATTSRTWSASGSA